MGCGLIARAVAAVLLAGTIGFTVSGCGCPTAQLIGTLVADGSDLVLELDHADVAYRIRWPAGFIVATRDGELVISDVLGNIKAREGDHVIMPGGEDSEVPGGWRVCGDMDDLVG